MRWVIRSRFPEHNNFRFLAKTRVSKTAAESMRNRKYASEKEEGKPRFLVFFNIEKVLPLIAAGKA